MNLPRTPGHNQRNGVYTKSRTLPRHGQIYRPMGSLLRAGGEVVFCSAPNAHRRDESAASYSLTGCTPALPASASLAGFILEHPAATVNKYNDTGENEVTTTIGNLGRR